MTNVVIKEPLSMTGEYAHRLLASELEILEVLWTDGPKTIIEVQRQLPKQPGYTTVQTRLNRMVKKGLLDRGNVRPAEYSAKIARESATVADLGIWFDKRKLGTIVPFVAQLLKDRRLSAKELEEIKVLIAKAEKEVKRNANR